MENKHSVDNLPQRHSNYEEESAGNLKESRHSNIFTPTPRFCNKSTEIQFGIKHKNRILGVGNQFGGHNNVPPRGENNGHNRSVQETPIIRENTTLRELTYLIGKLISTYQAVLLAPLHCHLLLMYQIRKLRVNLSYKGKISLNAASLEELKWWCHNINLNKGRPIKIQNVEIPIQSDAVKSGGWGAH